MVSIHSLEKKNKNKYKYNKDTKETQNTAVSASCLQKVQTIHKYASIYINLAAPSDKGITAQLSEVGL